ncbi:MAG: TraR/DksA family transcriptional regulator [Candidatus Brocadiia bacterium]
MSHHTTTKRRRQTSVERLRKALLKRREQLLEGMNEELAASRPDTLGARFDDVADRASEALYDDLAQGYAEIASANLRKINRAIERMDDGTYGLCETCGAPIPAARLRLLPFAHLCVECQRREEAEEAAANVAPAGPRYPLN